MYLKEVQTCEKSVKYCLRKLNKEDMKSEYNCGDILFNESNNKPFIHDGEITGDGLGVVIGFAYHKDKLVLCRTSGKGNYQVNPSVVRRTATEAEKQWLMNQIAIAKDIPFYSCI